MSDILQHDNDIIDRVLNNVVADALIFLSDLNNRSVGASQDTHIQPINLPDFGMGVETALALFKERFEPFLSGGVGSRYFGFVTGGVTPAALAGDWLTSIYDQNALGSNESIAPQLELETIGLLRSLFGLSSAQTGTFVSGATMSNFVGLAIARQWVGYQHDIDVGQSGLWRLKPIKLFSATPHTSIYKALSMLGMGRENINLVETLPDREAIDLRALECLLKEQNQQPCVVIANAGTINTVDFDDLDGLANLKRKYNFWLHVDAAFGGFAACSSQYRHWVKGIDRADSITIDAHKWLNVPYDSAIQFTRHQQLQSQVFQNSAAYLAQEISASSFVHLTPENSRRLRALPSWFTLMAYGKAGYAEIVEQSCRLTQLLGNRIGASDMFELLAPVRLNGICFTLKSVGKAVEFGTVQKYLRFVQESGKLFLTPTVFQEIAAMRISITNWRTTEKDVEIAWQGLQEAFFKLNKTELEMNV